MSNKHTRKTFFAKAVAALAGIGLIGAGRASVKSASATAASPAPTAAPEDVGFAIRPDARAVARSADSV